MAKPTRMQKALLVFGSVGLLFLLAEAGMRLGRRIFNARQEYLNSFPPGEERFRILCLGESTTALGGEDSYPSQLETILNARRPSVKFKVLNKGVVGAQSRHILAGLDENIRKYSPRMAVIMMGVNDEFYYLNRPAGNGSGLAVIRGKLRIFSLFQLLWEHARFRLNEARNGFEKQGCPVRYAPETARSYRAIAALLRRKGIAVIAMQYPRRDAAPLKEIFPSAWKIAFVENRANFEEALKKGAYSDLFTDDFARDFGHCTRAGNRLIAENLARTILGALEKSHDP